MARRGENQASNLEKTTRAMVAVAQVPLTMRERLNKGLLPVAFVGGLIGMGMLASCGALYLLPEESWPEALEREHLGTYMTLSLLAASLLGWGCMQKGLGRMRKAVGQGVGGWLFVGLPMACAASLLALSQGWLDPGERYGPGLYLFSYWYPPGLVAVSLLAYVTGRSRLGEQGRFERGLLFTVLVAPYALLMAYLVVGFKAPWIDDRLEESIQDLGSGAIVAQVALAYFCGGGSSSS
jgi:hypothetical protein